MCTGCFEFTFADFSGKGYCSRQVAHNLSRTENCRDSAWEDEETRRIPKYRHCRITQKGAIRMILTCGEALIDFISHTDSEGNLLFKPCPGGSPLNTAIAVARLGVPAGFLGRLSTDMFGDQLMEHLTRNGIDLSFVLRSDAPSALSFVKKKADDSAQYAFYAENSATWDLKNADIPYGLSGRAACFQFGSISMLMRPFSDTVAGFIAQWRDSVVVSFDPNIRPEMIASRRDYLEKFEKWVPCCTIVKMSDEDLAWLYPELSIEDGLFRMLEMGASLAVITCGEKGAMARNAEKSVSVPLYTMPLMDTVGAGDTFHGSMLAWLYRRRLLDRSSLAHMPEAKLREALRYAVKAAAINCSRQGADPPWSDQLKSEDGA